MKKTSTKPSAAERAVADYRAREDELEEFMKDADNREIIEELYALVNARNGALDTAMRQLKSELQRSELDKLTIEGMGAQKKYKRFYNGELLANLLPANQSDEILTETVIYTVDKDRLETLLRQGEIDAEIVRRAYVEELQNPANMPGTPKAFTLPPLPVLSD